MATVPEFAELELSRLHIRHVSAVVKGGVLLASAYLKDGEGMGATNWRILAGLFERLSGLGMPFIVAGDFNNLPKEVEDTGLLSSVKAFIVEPGRKTCRAGNGRCIDFFILSECLRQHVLRCE
eukprot:4933104-Lingulodinium_polyedra.AAC.1